MNTIVHYTLKVLGYIVMFILCLECALYLSGYSTYSYQEYKVESHPHFPYLPDDSLGLSLNPGSYKITLNDSLVFKANHLKTGVRSCSNLPMNPEDDEVHFLGCSFTYGYGVNDFQTFVALYQAEHPRKKVFNRGVIGYGTVQNYIQLKRILNAESIGNKTINVVFSSHHLHRNTLSNSFRKDLKIGFANSSTQGKDKLRSAQFPYVDASEINQIKLESWGEIYKNWTGRSTFRVVNWLQNWTDYFVDVSDVEVDVAYELLNQMVVLCDYYSAEFNLIILDESPKVIELKKRLTKAGISFMSIAFDFKNKDLTNYPYDSHPSVKGHQFIYDKMIQSLK